MERVQILRSELRVWQDERLGKLWRIAYRDGADETVVSFPDAEAMGDFIAEQFGLDLIEFPEQSALAA